MSGTVPVSKDPAKVRAGKASARARWGPDPHVIRLRDVSDPHLRAAYLALHRLGQSRAANTEAIEHNTPA